MPNDVPPKTAKRMGRPRKSGPLAPFGDRLRAAIQASKFDNRSRFIKALGVDFSTVHRWETGETEPAPHYLEAAAALLGCTVSDLTGQPELLPPELVAFLEAQPEYDPITPTERAWLVSLRLPGGKLPSRAMYHSCLLAFRVHASE